MAQYSIDTTALRALSGKLGQLNRSAFPIAVRGTLNRAAFDMKGGPGSSETLRKSAEKTFKKRYTGSPFKAFSRVEKASGFNVESMRSTVGFIDTQKSKDFATDLEKQEEGGVIAGRSFVPMDPARRSGKMIKPENIISAIRKKKIIKAADVNTPDKKQKFIRAAFMAKKLHPTDAYVLGGSAKGGEVLSRINKIGSSKSGKKITLSRTPLFTVKKGRVARVKATNFSKRAAYETGLKLDRFYQEEAERQFKKYLK